MTKLEQKLEELSRLKQECVDIVLDDSALSNVDKLNTIYQTGLWGYSSYISGVFDEWEEECVKEEERLAIADGKVKDKDYICTICDYDLIENRERHETIDYLDLIYDNEPYGEDEDDSKILVVTCRGKYKAKIYKTYKEISDYISRYAIENKSIGFNFDW